MIEFLGARAIPGVERAARGVYERTFAVGGARGVVQVESAASGNHLLATIHTSDVTAIAAVVARLRRLLDLDVDIAAVDAHLAGDRRLGALVRQRPGVRVPGAWDGFELAVRALLGQQITVAGARTMAGRVAASYGEALGPGEHAGEGHPDRLSRPPRRSRAVTWEASASHGRAPPRCAASREAMDADPDLLATLRDARRDHREALGASRRGRMDRAVHRDARAARAGRVPRVRPRAPSSDGHARRAPGPATLERSAEAWRPWRAYAAMRLWIQGGEAMWWLQRARSCWRRDAYCQRPSTQTWPRPRASQWAAVQRAFACGRRS